MGINVHHPDYNNNYSSIFLIYVDYQKMKAHALAIAEEIGRPFDYNEVPLDTASQEDLNLIDLAIDDEEHDECGEDWTSKLGINLRYCAKVRKNSPPMQVQHALTLGGLFSDKSPCSEFLTIKWQSRRSRSKKLNHSSPGKVCERVQLKDEVVGERSNGIIVNNEKKLLQYSRRNHKLKLSGSTGAASMVDGCPGKNVSKDVSAATYGDCDKQSGKASENGLSKKGNSRSESAGLVFSSDTGMSEAQHETVGFAATSGMSLKSAPSQIEDFLASDTLVLVDTQSENHSLNDFDIDGKACDVAAWDSSEMQPKNKSTDETNEYKSYAEKCASPLIIAMDESSGMQGENQSMEKISITNESCHLVSEGQCNVSGEGDVLMNEVSDLSKSTNLHVAEPVVRNFEVQTENVVLEESCVNNEVLVCMTLDNEVQQKIHTTSRIDNGGSLSSNVTPMNQNNLASTEGVSCNVAVTNQPTLASMQESCECPRGIHAAEDISIDMSSDAVGQELKTKNGSNEDEPVSCCVTPTNNPTPPSREIHSPDRDNEELVSSAVSPMEVSQPSYVSLEQCPEVPKGCSVEEDLHDGVTLDTEVLQEIQTSNGTDEGAPVSSVIMQVENEHATISGGECHEVPRGTDSEENLSGGVTLDNEMEQKKPLTNKNDKEISRHDTRITPPSPASIQKCSRIQRHTHAAENLLGSEVCSSQDDRELEGIESTVLDLRSSSDKRRKRKREAEHLTEDKLGSNGFIRGPCEGLRPRAGKDATSSSGVEISKTVEEKLVRKKVSKPSDVSLPPKNRSTTLSHKSLPPKNKNITGSHKCDLEGCRMSFKTKADLLLHKRNRCPHEGCGKKFSSHKYATLHQRVHDDDRPLKCPWKGCSMSFKWAWARTEHIRVHTGERPYKCKIEGCGLSFRFVSDFSRHRRKTGHYVNSPA